MINPFKNDPFAMVWQAFQNLYPDNDCKCWFDDIGQKDENGDDIAGFTLFSDDENELPLVFVDVRLPVSYAIDTFAHELAHVVAGVAADHNEKWKEAFDALFNEYNRIGDEMFDEHKPIEAIEGERGY